MKIDRMSSLLLVCFQKCLHFQRIFSPCVPVGSGPSKFVFVGHMDTVNVEDASQWSLPPFAADIDQSTQRLIGRGACDNKGGIVCALYTLYALQQFITGQSVWDR